MNFTLAEKILYVLMRCLIPAAILGQHGIGKTSLGMQLARRRRKELRQNYKDIGLSSIGMKFKNDDKVFGFWPLDIQITEKDELIGWGVHTDLRKMAFEAALKDGTKDIASRSAKILAELKKLYETDREIFVEYVRGSRFLPPAGHNGGGIWFPDELNRDKTGVAGPVAQIALTGGFLDYELPEDVWVMTSMNPPGDDYDVSELDSAMMSRFAVFAVRSDINTWTNWALEAGLDRNLIATVGTNASRVFNPHDKVINIPNRDCTSRLIQNLNTVRNFLATDEGIALAFEKEEEVNLYNAVVGESAGPIFYADFANPDRERPVPARDILDSYGWSQDHNDRSWDGHYGLADAKLSPVRARVKAMIPKEGDKGGKLEAGLLNVTSSELARWVSDMHAGLSNKRDFSEKDFRGWMNLVLYARDLAEGPTDLARGLITHPKLKAAQEVIVEMSKRQEDLQQELMVAIDFDLRHLREAA